jgi:heavy metal sensor kinase
MRLEGRRLSIRTRLTLWYTVVLLAIVLVISAFSYFMLRRSLIRDADVQLAMVGQVVRDAGIGEAKRSEVELHQILGPEFFDIFFRVTGLEGQEEGGSAALRGRPLPLSVEARERGRDGESTFETVALPGRESLRVRLLTIPLGREPARFIQVGVAFDEIDHALIGYLETLGIMVPLGLGLAAIGGALLARSALKPVDRMSRTARRITAEDLTRRLALRGTGDELDHLAETLNATFDRLEEAFSHVRRFAADAAHELRTPLTALKGGIEVALRAQRSPQDYRTVLRSSLEEVDRLIRLAENLLLLSRLRMSGPPSHEPVELEPLLMDVLDVGLRLADGRGVIVRIGRVEPVTVTGDLSTLRRALLNLVENAIKYTHAGGRVELSAERDGHQAVVAVRDTGVGMDPADVDRIFEPFVRLDLARASDTGGAGLGLSIVQSIVSTHAGTLSVESAPGAGSTFTIRLPLG